MKNNTDYNAYEVYIQLEKRCLQAKKTHRMKKAQRRRKSVDFLSKESFSQIAKKALTATAAKRWWDKEEYTYTLPNGEKFTINKKAKS